MLSAASRMMTSRPASASARATARPTTPAPATTQSTSSTPDSPHRNAGRRVRLAAQRSPYMLSLNAGASSIVVAPEFGGGLTGWMVGRTPMLRRALPQATVGGDRHALGCFPLLPYGNRIGRARFRWSDVDYTLQRNFGDAPHTIHGLGWQRCWTVATSTTRSVTLRLRHDPGPSWPFAFSAEVGYSLSETALTVTI